ncbi:MAG: T9SS type A sorting domain-containing protein [Bacteroidota bacterium]
MKTKNIFVTILFLNIIGTTVSAQSTFQKSLGGSAEDFGTTLKPTSDNGFILVGTTASYGAGGDDIYLIKLNADGDTIWTKTYGGSDDEYGSSVKQTSDGGYIISGDTKSFGVAGKDVYLIKTDMNGNLSWSKTFGSVGNDYGNTVLQTTDGGYLVSGTTENIGAGNYNVYFIKINSTGDTLWTKTYGGALEDDGNYVIQTSGGGYIMIGTTVSFGAGGDDIYVIKTNSSGDTLWTKSYGGIADDYGFSIDETTDEGFILTGTTKSYGAGDFDCYLLKINTSGDVEWSKTYGSSATDIAGSVLQTNDGGYIMLGQSFGFGIASDLYLVKTNATGDTAWTRIYGGSDYEFESCVLQTSDGGYLISAGEESFGPDRDIYLIKTDADGNSGCYQGSTPTIINSMTMPSWNTATIISAGGTTSTPGTIKSAGCIVNTFCTTVAINESVVSPLIIIYPNPADDFLEIKNSFSGNENATVKIFDVTGKEIFTSKISSSNFKIQTSEFSDGIYFCQLKSNDKIFNQKFIVQH